MAKNLELAAWQAVAKNPNITDVFAALGERILAGTSSTHVLLRHFDLEHHKIDTLARADADGGKTLPGIGTTADESFGDLISWARAGEQIRAAKRADHPLAPVLLPKEHRGALAAAPLFRGPDAPAGALLIVGSPMILGEAAQAVLHTLMEPMAVALENDRRIHRLMRAAEAHEADNRALLSRLDRHDLSESVVGSESGLRDVTEKVAQVAPTDAPVLILGETGAGKEVVARAIHNNSKRASGPMVRVNCGAIPQELVDSELFGHEQGSFTGASVRRKGWFERADGGTLFLDEIGELPAAAQVRLLRVLQDGLIDRVGAQKSITVDVRIVAATHRDLQEMVRARLFRQDLWYRISVFPIRLPPLRERVEDIPALAAHFARRAAKRLGAMPLALNAEDISLLVSYPWPGNVRELAAVIERAAILGSGHHLEIEAALGVASSPVPAPAIAPPAPVHANAPHANAPHANAPHANAPHANAPHANAPHANAPHTNVEPGGRPLLPSSSSLDAAMVRHIEAALSRSRGRIDGPFGAATALGINPHTLRARMRKLGIDWRRFRG